MINDHASLESVFRSPSVPLTLEQSELRKRVLKQIENEPETFDMTSWELHSPCGTTRCIAGWAVHIGTPHFMPVSVMAGSVVEAMAIELLGLTEEEFEFEEGGNSLFYTMNDFALEKLRKLASSE